MSAETENADRAATTQEAKHPFDALFVDGKMQLNVTPEMQDQARAIAMQMDRAVRFDQSGRGAIELLHETLAPDRQYQQEFANLLQATIAANPSLIVKKYQLIGPARDPSIPRPASDRNRTQNHVIVQFTANMRLAIMDALDGLVVDAARAVKEEDEGFNTSSEYAPKQRNRHGDIMMVQTHRETGIPFQHQIQIQFTNDVFAIERGMHKASRALRTSRADETHGIK